MILTCVLKINPKRRKSFRARHNCDNPIKTKARYWSCSQMVEGGYTEYGYRGLEELKQANDKISELQEKINKLQEEIKELKQRLEYKW